MPFPADLIARLPVVGAADPLLGGADSDGHATVVVDDGSGPHSTLVGFTVAAGRVWFTTGRSAFKIGVMREHPVVAMLLPRDDRGWISVHGTATVIDAFRPQDTVRAIDSLARSGVAAARYLGDHPDDLIGYAIRAGQVPLDWLPPQRVLVAVDPQRVLVVDRVGEITRRRGRWSPLLPRPAHTDVALPVLVAGPEWARDRIDTAGPTSIGWGADDGLVAMPGSWHGDRADFDVPTALLQAAGTPSSAPVSVTLEAPDRGIGPTGNCGLCLRGVATVVAIGPERSEASLALERLHWWEGFKTGTLEPR